jgi:hypothetical protein
MLRRYENCILSQNHQNLQNNEHVNKKDEAAPQLCRRWEAAGWLASHNTRNRF